MERITYSEHEEPIVLSKALFDLLLKQEHSAELIALYSFYYYTAKWQKTNIPKAVNTYVGKALDWSDMKVSRYKSMLIDLGLIENCIRKDDSNNKILGHYIKVNFIWSKHSVETIEKTITPKNHSLEILSKKTITPKTQGVAFCGTNALNSNNILNALNSNSSSCGSGLEFNSLVDSTNKITPNQFEDFWQIYPKKADKGKALTAWNKLCKKNSKERPNFRMLRKAIIDQKKSQRWQEKTYIPLASTWLNQSRWLDDPNEMIVYGKNNNRYEPANFEPMFEEMGKTNGRLTSEFNT
jgi:hypothetical protein